MERLEQRLEVMERAGQKRRGWRTTLSISVIIEMYDTCRGLTKIKGEVERQIMPRLRNDKSPLTLIFVI